MQLIIDRNLWLRGEGHDASALHRKSDGKMCCLGIYGLACGLPLDKLTGKNQPNELKGYPEWLLIHVTPSLDSKAYTGCSTDCGDLIMCNDAKLYQDPEREAKITEIFSRHDVEVTFVG